MGKPSIPPGEAGGLEKRFGNIAVCLNDMKTQRRSPDGKAITITLCQDCSPLTPAEIGPNTVVLNEIPA